MPYKLIEEVDEDGYNDDRLDGQANDQRRVAPGDNTGGTTPTSTSTGTPGAPGSVGSPPGTNTSTPHTPGGPDPTPGSTTPGNPYNDWNFERPQFGGPTPFSRTPYAPPPPPAPPPAPPPPPNFAGAANAGPMGPLPQFNAPGAPGDAPNYLDILNQYAGQEPGQNQPGFDLEGYMGEGPDLQQFVPGEYETPDNAFMGEGLYGDLEAYARDWMDNYNPYDNEYANAARADMEQRLERSRERGTQGIEEWAAGRGLVGSTAEGQLQANLSEGLTQQELEAELGLLDRMVGAESEGRAAAGQFGLQTADLGARLGQIRQDEARTAQELAMARGNMQISAADRQDAAKLQRAALRLEQERSQFDREGRMAGLALNAAQLQEQSQQFRAQFDLQVEQAGFDAAFRNATLESQNALQQAELNLRAAQAGDNAALTRASIELDKMRAMDQALMTREQLKLQSDQMDLRAWEVYEGLVQRGQDREWEMVRFEEEMKFRKDELEERRRQFNEDLDFRYWDSENRNILDVLRQYGIQ